MPTNKVWTTKNKIKERYYKQKLAILERNTESTARMTYAYEKITNSLDDISKNASIFLSKI